MSQQELVHGVVHGPGFDEDVTDLDEGVIGR
jgi:hypothetical protein